MAPLSWVQFGVAVNPVVEYINEMTGPNSFWAVAYRGCKPGKLVSILKHRTLLCPGDITRDNKLLAPHRFHGTDCYHLSPSMKYASHEYLVEPVTFEGSQFEVVIAFKVKTSGMTKQKPNEMLVDFSVDERLLQTTEFEWFSKRRGCVHPFAVLIRAVP